MRKLGRRESLGGESGEGGANGLGWTGRSARWEIQVWGKEIRDGRAREVVGGDREERSGECWVNQGRELKKIWRRWRRRKRGGKKQKG